jgi:hypothetical protein
MARRCLPYTRKRGILCPLLAGEGTIVNSLFTPSSIEGTLILLPIAAAFGWAYGFVGHVGYAKQVAYTDPERSLAATTGVLGRDLRSFALMRKLPKQSSGGSADERR